jgi:hypothetical protein
MVELLEMLFPDGLEYMPQLISQVSQGDTLNMLALGYKLKGELGRAVLSYRRAIAIALETKNNEALSLAFYTQNSKLITSLGATEICSKSRQSR